MAGRPDHAAKYSRKMMQQHRMKLFVLIVLAFTWLSFHLGHSSLSGAGNDVVPLREYHRSLRPLVEYFDPHSRVPYDGRTITIYLVEPPNHAPNLAYSIFKTGMLERYGSGRFDYVVREHTRCDASCTRPLMDVDGPCVAAARANDCAEEYLRCNYPTCKTMLVGDESCRAETHDVREYYSADRGTKAYLPLGPRLDSWKSFRRIRARPGFAVEKSSRRKFAFNAIFSQSTNEGRRGLAEIIEGGRDGTYLQIYTQMARKWTRLVNSRTTEQLRTESYVTVLMDSVFTLSPAGYNPECYRLFEAVEAGSIPVLVKKDFTTQYFKRCKDALHHWHDAPILVLDSWNDLFPTIEGMMEDKEALDKMQLNLLIWYEEYMHKVVGDFEDFMLESYRNDFLENNARELAENPEHERDGDGEGLDADNAEVAASPSAIEPCDDIVLFVPDIHLSLGRQLNNYILAAMLATFMNKPMVILDAPPELMCPGEVEGDHPLGFSSIVKSPTWLTRGCAVPCQGRREYSGWDDFRRMARDSPVRACANGDGSRAHVLALGGDETRIYFEEHFKDAMLRLSPSVAYGWASRAGADPRQSEIFSKLEGGMMWDYLGALLVRSDVLRLQPRIVKDLDEFITTFIFPQGHKKVSYDAIRIRRGEDDPEASWFVDNYWDARGYSNQKPQAMERNYIPLLHYLRHYNSMECSEEVRKVYIATDDRAGVKREIAELGPKSDEGILFNNCHKIKFKVSPVKADLGTVGCDVRYANDIASIADFVVLRNANTFVGEFHSEWGKLIRMFRLVLNEEVGPIADRGISRLTSHLVRSQKAGSKSDRSPLSLKNTKVAWGHLHPPTPL